MTKKDSFLDWLEKEHRRDVFKAACRGWFIIAVLFWLSFFAFSYAGYDKPQRFVFIIAIVPSALTLLYFLRFLFALARR